MPHRFLFVMDPLSQVLVDKDTTFAFMLEAVARKHEVYFAGLKDLVARGHQPYAFARRCEVASKAPTGSSPPERESGISLRRLISSAARRPDTVRAEPDR